MKKISVVVPCYGTEKYIDRCLDSILNQTYKNLEIIVVNDCSPGNMLEILNDYAKKDNRIKIVDNKVNQGLYKTRCIGSTYCTGDYIAFVDSDDYLDLDYFRMLQYTANKENSDIVISNFARVGIKKDNIYIYNMIYNSHNCSYSGDDILENYFRQEGRNYRYHIICSKLINIEIWKKAFDTYSKLNKNIVMTEDFIFSSIIMYYAEKISFCDDTLYFYCENENQSTSSLNVSADKIKKNVFDIINSFDFVKSFLKTKNNVVYKKYIKNINEWEYFYICLNLNLHKGLKHKDKEQLFIDVYGKDKKIKKYFENFESDNSTKGDYYKITSKWDSRLSDLKEKIISKDVKVISFDMFDTLVWRPFIIPSDMFKLMDKDFNELFKENIPIVKFSNIRKECEAELRNIFYKNGVDEITLDEIYSHISKKYNVSISKLNKLKKLEQKLEEKFCFRRESAYQLYLLAKELGKKVIVTSDMYLPMSTIKNILRKNDYEFDEIYLSSEIKKTKSKGNLFEYVIEKEKTNSILHIGDSEHSDFNKPKEYGLDSCLFYKAYDSFVGSSGAGNIQYNFELLNHDYSKYLETSGVRSSIAIIANKYFDNPFNTFNIYSDFNVDPFLVGYFSLGMHLLSLSYWLLKDTNMKNIDTLAFMARDGYLPMKTCEILQNNTKINKHTDLEYVYLSRKSLTPLVLKNKFGLSMLNSYLVNIELLTPKDVIEQLDVILELPNDIKDVLKKNNIQYNKKFKDDQEFNKCIDIIYDNCFSKDKYKKYYDIAKKYFKDIYRGKTATFDIGYSGKPETILSSILNKDVTTYFIHTNGSTGYDNSILGNYELNTFYDFTPTITGTLRELLISDIGPSCIGYTEENGKVVPKFGKKTYYDYYNYYVITEIQKAAEQFVSDFINIFKDYIDDFDFNKYYMSIPYEYFLHYFKYNDFVLVDGLVFEDNVNNYVPLKKFLYDRIINYNSTYNLHHNSLKNYSEPLREGYGKLPRNRITRAIYYYIFDRETYNNKLDLYRNRCYTPDLLPNNRLKRIIYYMLFNRKYMYNKLRKK